jgi:hypothetical protein
MAPSPFAHDDIAIAIVDDDTNANLGSFSF